MSFAFFGYPFPKSTLDVICECSLCHLHGQVGDGAEDGRVVKVESVVGPEDGVVLVVGRRALGGVDLLATFLGLLDCHPLFSIPLPY